MSNSEGSVKRVIFLYGTETGMSEEYAHMAASIAANNGAVVTVLPVDGYPLSRWGHPEADGTSPFLVFFVSTAGQGEMPLTMKETWEVLRMSDAPDIPESCNYAVFGLGDSTYARYNYAGKMFHNRLQQLGATPVVHRGLGDERDGKGIAQELNPWLDQLWTALGIAIVSPGPVVPKNKYTVEEAGAFVGHSRSDSRVDNASADVVSPRVVRPGCWNLTVSNNTKLTAESHFQHVSYVEFLRDTENIDRGAYQPGDCLSLYPTNSPTEVNRMLKALRVTAADAASKLYTITTNTSWGIVELPPRPFLNTPITLLELFTRFIDLEGTASQTFLRMFSVCAGRAGDAELEERMRDLGTPANCEDYNSFGYREKRTMVEVMEDFPQINVSIEELISNAPVMRPRYYSISSSPTMDTGVIGLTVALFHITTPLGRDRKGLCSRWLCQSTSGSTIEGCFLHRPFDINPKAPLILVGPGTGVAPLRGLIRERAASAVANGTGAPPEMILFFGCRNKAGDYIHGEEWPQFAPALKVVTAFSRDDPNGKKEYVQHKLIDDSAAATKVFKLLTNTDEELYGGGGVVIICGNAKHMPKSVQDALASILAAGTGISKDDALTEVNRLRLRGRIFFETWSV